MVNIIFNYIYVFFILDIDIYLDGITNVSEIFSNRSHSNGLHYVIDFTLEELQRLNVHERVLPLTDTQVFPLRFPSKSNIPFRLSTLNETIELILGLNHATNQKRELLIEIKKPEYHYENNKAISSIVLETLKAYNLTRSTDPVIIQTFHIEELIYIRKNLGSQLRLFALMTLNEVGESSSDYDFYRSEEGIRNLSGIVQALAPYLVFVVEFNQDQSINGITNLVKWAHQYNLSVYPFTFRKDQFPGPDFEEFIKYFWHTAQVDGFISDHPDVILEILERQTTSSGIYLFLSIVLNILPILITALMFD